MYILYESSFNIFKGPIHFKFNTETTNVYTISNNLFNKIGKNSNMYNVILCFSSNYINRPELDTIKLFIYK